MNKELIFNQIKNNYLEKGSIIIENNEVILNLNKLVLVKILTHICFPFRISELEKWKEDNKIIDFPLSELCEEYFMELYATLKATFDIAILENEITEEENMLFFSYLEFKIDDEIYELITSL